MGYSVFPEIFGDRVLFMRSSEYLCRATTVGQIGSISVRRAKEKRDEQKCLVGIEVLVKKHITESILSHRGEWRDVL